MMVNVGCGNDRRAGYVNVDLRSDVADVVAAADRLPFGDGAVGELLALDILEHFPASDTPGVLAEWRRVLCDGGRLVVKVPNMLELSRWIVEGRHVVAAIRNVYGGHRWGPGGAWDAHHTGWTPELFEQELARSDFHVLENDGELNMRVVAVPV